MGIDELDVSVRLQIPIPGALYTRTHTHTHTFDRAVEKSGTKRLLIFRRAILSAVAADKLSLSNIFFTFPRLLYPRVW